METVLEVRNLTKTFPKRGSREALEAVADVSFRIEPGECLAVIGGSGSGKTTVAKMITRLLPADSGQIFLMGEEITHAKGKALRTIYRKMQMVFQTPAESFDPRRTLGESAAESLCNQGIGKAEAASRVQELFLRCGLPEEYLMRYPHEVSGGQCQRAAIARAAVLHPALLILDEATSALDMTVQKEILELLSELRREEGMTYLFISHDIALVQQFCDRVLVMDQGRMIEVGTPDDVIRAPRQEYTKRLIESIL